MYHQNVRLRLVLIKLEHRALGPIILAVILDSDLLADLCLIPVKDRIVRVLLANDLVLQSRLFIAFA